MPKHTIIWGLSCKKKNEFEKAIFHYTEALRIKPNYPTADNNLGIILYKEGKYEESIPHFLKALDSNPDYLEARRNLYNVLQKLREK